MDEGFSARVSAIYDFVNGFQDSANVVATMIASRALSARGALLLAAAGTLAGPFVIGVAVARTVGSEVLSADAITVAVAMAAPLAATFWNLAAWYFSVPVSSSRCPASSIAARSTATCPTWPTAPSPPATCSA